MGDTVTWVEITEAQHDQMCKASGIPKPGENQASGDVALGCQWTTAYIDAVLDGGILKAQVSDTDVKTYGLTTTKAPAFPVLGDTKTPVPQPVRFDKPVPTAALDIAVVLVDRGITTKEAAAQLLAVDPVALEQAVAAQADVKR